MENLNRISCIYCGNTLSLKNSIIYSQFSLDTLEQEEKDILKHLKTKKHINTKKRLIDEHLLFMPKDINEIIFEYFDDTPLEIIRYKRIKREKMEQIRRMREQEYNQRQIDNKWYNKYPRKFKNFMYKVFNPYD